MATMMTYYLTLVVCLIVLADLRYHDRGFWVVDSGIGLEENGREWRWLSTGDLPNLSDMSMTASITNTLIVLTVLGIVETYTSQNWNLLGGEWREEPLHRYYFVGDAC